GLETALAKHFGTKKLGDSKVPLIIPSYYPKYNDVYLFKTPHHRRLQIDGSSFKSTRLNRLSATTSWIKQSIPRAVSMIRSAVRGGFDGKVIFKIFPKDLGVTTDGPQRVGTETQSARPLRQKFGVQRIPQWVAGPDGEGARHAANRSLASANCTSFKTQSSGAASKRPVL